MKSFCAVRQHQGWVTGHLSDMEPQDTPSLTLRRRDTFRGGLRLRDPMAKVSFFKRQSTNFT